MDSQLQQGLPVQIEGSKYHYAFLILFFFQTYSFHLFFSLLLSIILITQIQFPHHTTNPQGAFNRGLLANTYVLDWPPRRGSRKVLIRSFIFDWIFVVCTLACKQLYMIKQYNTNINFIGCAIWFAEPPGNKYFRLDDPDLSYPDVSSDDVVFPSFLLHILYWVQSLHMSYTFYLLLTPIQIPPLIILSLAQIWLRNFAEWHHTLLSFVETIGMYSFILPAQQSNIPAQLWPISLLPF